MTTQEPKNRTKEFAYTVILVSALAIFTLLLFTKISEVDKNKRKIQEKHLKTPKNG